jgi:predicted dehydrogenase
MERIAAAARTHPAWTLSAPYCWRNHPASERMREIVAAGLIGDVTAAEARLNAGGAHRYVRDNCEWVLESREGGGPMWNLGVHWIDFLRWMTGKEIATVCGAVSGPFGEPERDIEDNAQALMTLRNGAAAMLDISYGLKDEYPGKRDIYIALRGTLGSVSWAPAWEGTEDELLLVSEHFSMSTEKCRRIRIVSKDIPGYGGQMGWAWLRDFAVSIHEGRKPPVSVNDMLAAVRVADAFYRSVKSGKRVMIA